VHLPLALFAMMAAPFWESLPPEEWSDGQIERLLHASPWAQEQGGTQFYIATARPVREAERELARRAKAGGGLAAGGEVEEYRQLLEDNPGKYIVLAVRVARPEFLENERELKTMEEKCVLRFGRARHRIVGHFPPTPADPYLRLVFPQAVTGTEREFSFELYLPGVPMPFRQLLFEVGPMRSKGSLEL
jgi:hypothetical protein